MAGQKRRRDASAPNNGNLPLPDNAHAEQPPKNSTAEYDESFPIGIEDYPEFLTVDVVVRKELECPICLGIIQNTRAIMECLHRFCRDCIEKYMRPGKKTCPVCRTHSAGLRALRADPTYDALIAVLTPCIDSDEEEKAFQKEENARKQTEAGKVSGEGVSRETKKE